MEARGMLPPELAKRVHADVVKWTTLIAAAGIQKR
jgi:hypothetical protein